MEYINGMAGGEMINAADINPTFKGSQILRGGQITPHGKMKGHAQRGRRLLTRPTRSVISS